MRTSSLLLSALLATAMAMPAAMAQNAGGTAAGGNAAGGAGNTGAGNAGASSAAALPSQRITIQSPASAGAIMTVSPSGIREIQQQLNRLGYNAGFVNGVWDRATEIAMTEFQRAHGLEPTGNLDFASVAAMGLWNNIIGNPIGNRNESIAGAQNSGVPPARGYGSELPNQRGTVGGGGNMAGGGALGAGAGGPGGMGAGGATGAGDGGMAPGGGPAR